MAQNLSRKQDDLEQNMFLHYIKTIVTDYRLYLLLLPMMLAWYAILVLQAARGLAHFVQKLPAQSWSSRQRLCRLANFESLISGAFCFPSFGAHSATPLSSALYCFIIRLPHSHYLSHLF